MQILIAEDEISLAKALKRILEQKGYYVDLVHDGASALDYAQGMVYQLVILDVMLPELDGFSVVRDYCGHGCGKVFHDKPTVLHYLPQSIMERKMFDIKMKPGMIFTIEPMINMGSCRIFTDKKNGWTVYTADGKPSAQWEVQIVVTDNGYEILAY